MHWTGRRGRRQHTDKEQTVPVMDLTQVQERVDSLDDPIRLYFGDRFEEILRIERGKYITELVVGLDNELNQTEIARFMRVGKTAINAWMKGTIHYAKFERFRALFSGRSDWLLHQKVRALIETINHFRSNGGPISTPSEFDREEYECLERVLSDDDWLEAQREEDKQTLERLTRDILREVHEVVPTRRVNNLFDVLNLMRGWQEWYLRCKEAVLRYHSGR